MTDTTSMSARDSIAGSASLFAELLDDRSEEAVPPGNETLDNLTKIVNDEVSGQFAHMQRASEDRLEIGREKQLTDYALLGTSMPDGIKMQITSCVLESHKINALTSKESDKLDHTTKLYSKLPEVHRALLEDLFKKVEAHLQVQVEEEVNKLARNTTTIIKGLVPINTTSVRDSVRARVSKVIDKKLLTSAGTATETAAGKDKIKEQDELL